MSKLLTKILFLLILFISISFQDSMTQIQVPHLKSPEKETQLQQNQTQQVIQSLNELPLYFIENKGQVEEKVHYQVKLSGMNVYFTSEEIVYHFFHREDEEVRVENIRMNFLGMNEGVELEGVEETEAKVNYFIGNNPERWVQGARTYEKIIYRELYPDIDLIVYGGRGKIKHEYRVRTGGEVGDIRLKYERADGLRLSEEGELEIILKGGELREGIPISYQEIDGERVEVESEYRVLEDNVIRFSVKEYKKDRELIIDPPLLYSTYLGGSGNDECHGIAIDGDGNSYVTGRTSSTDFPTSPGAYDTSHNGGGSFPYDVFITKLNSTGSDLIYSTYLGGSDLEEGFGLALDESGNAYVTGFTRSADFPTTSGAFDRDSNGDLDVFITKLDSTGSALPYSTYLGGSLWDEGRGIAVDGYGNAYVTGYTDSPDFPTTGAYDTTRDGFSDAFITKLNPSGSTLSYSTYLGGSDYDEGWGIAVDGYGNAYVTGYTDSTDFPTTSGAFDTTHNGNYDVFVTKLNSTGTALSYSTYLGGNFWDEGYGIAVDGSGNAYVTGYTDSTDFPTTSGAFDTTHNGNDDVFVTNLNSTGTDLLYSIYLGGSDDDYGSGIEIDGSGNAYVTGSSKSFDFPTTSGAYDKIQDGNYDAFITKLNSTGTALSYSTYLGRRNPDYGSGIEIDGSGNIYVAGVTGSSEFPTTPGAYDTSYNFGYQDAFVTKLIPCILPGEPSDPSPADGSTSVSVDIDLDWSDSVGASSYDVYLGTFSSPPLVGNVSASFYDPGTLNLGATYYWKVMAKNACGETSSSEWEFTTESGIIQYTLSISTSTGGTTDPAPGDHLYDEGTPVGIEAISDSGYRFSHWSGDVPTGHETDNPVTITVDADKSITAYFEEVQYELVISAAEGGTTDPVPGTHSYSMGTSVEVEALPDSGYVFSHWTGDVPSEHENDNPLTIVMDTNKSIAAHFNPIIGKDDIVGTWSSGVWYRNSENGGWVNMSSPANLVAASDVDGDGIDDLIGVWSSGLWVNFSSSASWGLLTWVLPTALASGDMNADGRDDVLGSWTSGVFYRDSITGLWAKISEAADLVAAGDIDGDGIDDLIGVWSSGLWVKYSSTNSWLLITSVLPTDIFSGDMNGDGRDDILGSWPSGVWYRSSIGGNWVKMSNSANLVAAGDIDGDGTDDLIGTWSSGLWVKNSSTASWQFICTSLPTDIDAGLFRTGWGAGAMSYDSPIAGVYAESPGNIADYEDLTSDGPGGRNFVYQEEENLIPQEKELKIKRIPGPGESGFTYTEQKNLVPGKRIKGRKEIIK